MENDVRTSGTTGSTPSGVALGDAPGLAWGLAKGGALGVQEPEGNEVLVGFDAVALFPSIEKELAVQVCRDALLDTEIKFLDTNLLEATRFLALTMDEEEKKSCKFRSYLPWRRKVDGKRTGKLGLTTANSLAPKVNDQSQWVWPDVVVSEEAEKEIVVEALARMVGIFCGTQTYTFGEKSTSKKQASQLDQEQHVP